MVGRMDGWGEDKWMDGWMDGELIEDGKINGWQMIDG